MQITLDYFGTFIFLSTSVSLPLSLSVCVYSSSLSLSQSLSLSFLHHKYGLNQSELNCLVILGQSVSDTDFGKEISYKWKFGEPGINLKGSRPLILRQYDFSNAKLTRNCPCSPIRLSLSFFTSPPLLHTVLLQVKYGIVSLPSHSLVSHMSI